MALVMPPLVQETSTTTGTGTYTLSGSAPTARQTFANAAADGQITTGDQVYYMVIDATGGPPDFEHGLGTWTSAGNTLTRDTILRSSNAGSAVSWGVGTRDVYIVGPQPAEKPVRTLVTRSTDQAISGSTSSAIQWQAEVVDTAGSWASSPNPTRITVPTGYNSMSITAQVYWAATTDTDQLQIKLTKGGLIVGYYSVVARTPGVSQAEPMQLSTGDVQVTAGTYFELVADNSSTNARNVKGVVGSGNPTWLAATFWRE